MRRILLIFLAVWTTLLGMVSDPLSARAASSRVLYTALTATTPQIPLWAAMEAGWSRHTPVTVRYWKTLDDLRGTMLAGKGDIWVGHLEGFAQAALRGAPVTLIAVTGWKKFSFIAPASFTGSGMAELAAAMQREKQLLAVAPQDSPALPLLLSISETGGPSFTVAAMQPQQLMLEMLRGTREYALLPEPLVSSLLARQPDVRVVSGLEDEWAVLRGGPPRLPLAGVAVNTRFLEAEPDAVRALVTAMTAQAGRLADNPEQAIAALPQPVRENLGDQVIRTSLARDPIMVLPAGEVRDEIRSFLGAVLPRTRGDQLDALLDGGFLLGYPPR